MHPQARLALADVRTRIQPSMATTDLIHLPPGSLRLGQALPFPIYDVRGKLMLAAGQVLRDSPLNRELANGGAWVRPQDTQEYQRALAHRLDTLVMQDTVLSDIAAADQSFQLDSLAARKLELTPREAWSDLLSRTHSLLREEQPADFQPRLAGLIDAGLKRLQSHPDAALLLVIYETSQVFEDYSARHALLSLMLGELVAQQLGLDEPQRDSLRRAAMTMNYGASLAHDRMAAQPDPASTSQRRAMDRHADLAAHRLKQLGVTDEAWLTAVRLHHEVPAGPLAGRSDGEALARILRRVDLFGARLSPRRSRGALSGAAAARAVYFDETGQPDEAGAALIKAVGLYPPGSIVRLANAEVGLVAKRGFSANEPQVAALIGKSGTPLTSPVMRDTRLATQAITASLTPQDFKLRVNLDALLKL